MTGQILKRGKQRTNLVAGDEAEDDGALAGRCSLCSSFRLLFSLVVLLFGSVLCVSFCVFFPSLALSLSLFLVFSFLCLVCYSDHCSGDSPDDNET